MQIILKAVLWPTIEKKKIADFMRALVGLHSAHNYSSKYCESVKELQKNQPTNQLSEFSQPINISFYSLSYTSIWA